MTVRTHNRTGIMHEGVTRSGYRLTCSAPDCNVTETLTCTKSSGFPHEVVTQKFSQKGWTVGRSPNHDLCPAHTRAKELRGSKIVSIQPTAIGAKFAEALAAAPEPEAHADAPRQMEKEDRRIIFAKLNDVYLDEERGYDAGWTDKRVADDLHVPIAWVRTIREDNFGPEGLSEADRAVLAAAKEFQEAIAHLTNKLMDIRALQNEAEKELDELKARFAPIARDVQDVRKAAVGA